MTEREEWLTVEEAAQRMKLQGNTILHWLRRGEMEGTKLNRRAGWRIAASEVERTLREGPRQTESQTEAGR